MEACDKLGHFEILGPLGAGDMGDMYRAKDTRLGREVAIKVLPGELERIVKKSLAKEPGGRYQHADDLEGGPGTVGSP